VWTEEDDKKLWMKGKWYAKDNLAEEDKVHPPDIWPHWSEGIPTKLRRKSLVVGDPPYRYREYYETLAFDWKNSQ
jgi:hypothetical protein